MSRTRRNLGNFLCGTAVYLHALGLLVKGAESHPMYDSNEQLDACENGSHGVRARGDCG